MKKIIILVFSILICKMVFAGDPYEFVREGMEYSDGYDSGGLKKLFGGIFIFLVNIPIFLGWMIFEKKGKIVIYGSLLIGFAVILFLSDNTDKYFELSRIFKTLAASLFVGLIIFFAYALISGFYLNKEEISKPREIKIIPAKIVKKIIQQPKVNIEKSCFLIIVRQWIGGPYWARAFPVEEVIKKLRKANINEPNLSKVADIINTMGDYKFNLIDELIDSGVEMVAESIDTSRVRAIRVTRMNANEKGWNVILSEFDTVTKV